MTRLATVVAGAGVVLALVAVPADAQQRPESAASGSPETAAVASAAADEHAADGSGGVVLVGVGGLAWTDVTADTMPTLWELTGGNAAASLSVRTIQSRTCPVDGWLTAGAGRRATDISDTTGDGQTDRFCREVPDPVESGDHIVVPGWDDLVEAQREQAYGAVIGLLGDRLHDAGVCSLAVGPGAALALADSTGSVQHYVPSFEALLPSQLAKCPVTVIDLGSFPIPDPDPGDTEEPFRDDHRTAAHAVDDTLARLLAVVPDDTAVLIAGIADSGHAPAPDADEPLMIAPSGLRLAVAAGPTPAGEPYGPHWLTSNSTRWTGLVQLTDIHATLAVHAGLDDPALGTSGAPWRTAGVHPADPADTIDDLIAADRATEVYRVQSGPFFQVLGAGQLVFFGGALLWMRLRPQQRTVTLRAVQVVAAAVASFPIASFLANVVGWWRYERAGTILWVTIAAVTAALAVLALTGPWRHRAYGPPGVIAGITAVVLAADVATGANLQQVSLLGLSPVVAGRFFGFGNIAFAIFAASVIVATAAVAQWLRDRGVATATVTMTAAACSVAAVGIMAAPNAGANFGGTMSLLPGLVLLVIGISGARVTIARLALAGVGAVVVVTLIAWLDWLRPAEARTHFGNFFADLLDGEAVSVGFRKLRASLGTLLRAPYYGALVPIAYVVISWLAHGPGIGGVRDLYGRWPAARHAIWAALLTGAIGFAVNDSGIIIPALLLTAGIPLLVSATAHATADGDAPRG